jgi:F-type H+-transporting ATPase subunit a
MDLRLIQPVPLAASGGGEHEGPGYFGLVFYVGLVLSIMALLIWQTRKGIRVRVFKNPVAQAAEQMYLFIEGMCVNIIGHGGRKYITFIGTLWFVIFVSNSVALFFASSPSADLSFNLAMALLAIAYVQFCGVQSHAQPLIARGMGKVRAWLIGIVRHMRHFGGPKMGRDTALEAAVAAIMPFMLFPIELISELMKNVSLPLRLFGNIHGGHVAVETLNTQYGPMMHFPVGGLLILVKLLTVIVQALVFTMLTCVYISLVTHHEEEHGGGHEPAHAH